jgi:polar amino acid transport system ATP-binding protein
MAFAREAADRVLYLEGGVVVEEGPPEQVLDEPQQEATRQFLRRFLSEGARAPTAADSSPASFETSRLVGRSGGGGSAHGHGGAG